jgi:hypothetical protein
VAADITGWKIIEEIRSKKGLPPLKEEGREPSYLATAKAMALGAADADEIEVIEEMV